MRIIGGGQLSKHGTPLHAGKGTALVEGTFKANKQVLADIFYENNQTIISDYTISTSRNAMSAGPITVSDGITVTIPDGASWSIV